MKRLRLWFAGTCAWFFFLFNLERLGDAFNLASFVYVMAFAVAMLLILIPSLQRISFAWLLAVALPPYFLLKSMLGYTIGGSMIPITVTEICALGLTMFLASHLTRRLESIKETLAGLTIGRRGEEAEPFASGQERIYSEIRRARLYERPATLLAISASEESTEISIDYFMKEAQREIIKQYIAARISELLVKELHDCDIVARRDSHFVTLLPETTRDAVNAVISRIQYKAAEELNLRLNIGFATFPDEAVTFESLLSIAEQQMNAGVRQMQDEVFPEAVHEAKPVSPQVSRETTVRAAS